MPNLPFTFAGQAFAICAGRALCWPARSTLIVADLHLGKSAVFRARGVPLPEGSTDADLRRLDAIIDDLRPERLLLLGDLFHARESVAPAAVAPLVAWRERRRSLHVVLVRGNHDRHAGTTPADLGFEVVEETLVEEGIEFGHEPRGGFDVKDGPVAKTLREGEAPAAPLDERDVQGPSRDTRGQSGGMGSPTSVDAARSALSRGTGSGDQTALPRLAGHVHPLAKLVDFDGSCVRVPCVCVDPNQVVLPAFGSLTGGLAMRPAPGRTLYAIAAGRVVRVPSTLR